MIFLKNEVQTDVFLKFIRVDEHNHKLINILTYNGYINSKLCNLVM